MHSMDKVSLLAIMMLIFFGMIMTITASTAVAERIHASHFHFVWKQIVFISISIPLMLATSALPQKALHRLGLIGFLFSIFFMLLLPYIGEEMKGAKRWMNIVGFSLQPSEIMKPFYVIVIAVILGGSHKIGKTKSYVTCFFLHAFVCLLLIIQPDLGMTITVSIVTITQMFVAGLPWICIIALVILLAAGTVVAYFTFPHAMQRISAFLGDDKTNQYQVQQSLESYIHGGLLGRGPGEGNTKYLLPDSHTDFIFAVAGEEFGAIFCLLLIGLIAFIVIHGLQNVITMSKSTMPKATKIYTAVGTLMYFAFQSIFNIGVTLHMFPTKGMTLPLISYGGSAMLSAAIGMGIYLNVTRKHNGHTEMVLRARHSFAQLVP